MKFQKALEMHFRFSLKCFTTVLYNVCGGLAAESAGDPAEGGEAAALAACDSALRRRRKLRSFRVTKIVFL